MKAKSWLILFLIFFILIFSCAGALVAAVDPFFHYHAPLSDKLYYLIDNQRSVNDGIVKHFDYDALITGSSMTTNFKTSEFDSLFDANSIKVPAVGASFFEINNLVNTAISSNPSLKTVLRGIDRSLLLYAPDGMRKDLGVYPEYLYDNNIFNDYKYVLNSDVIFSRTIAMLLDAHRDDFHPGISGFDQYSNWMPEYADCFGQLSSDICRYGFGTVGTPVHLSDEDREILTGNIHNNAVSIALNHPDITFYYFFTPYSLAYWHDLVASGEIYRQIEIEQTTAELLLACDNIELYDFSSRTDITANINNYKDITHYGEWVNSLILKWIHDGEYRLSADTCDLYFSSLLDYYLSADYSAFFSQPRYNCDYYAAALVNHELRGIIPRSISNEEILQGDLRNAEFRTDENGDATVYCVGCLDRGEDWDLSNYLINNNYVGIKLHIPDAADYSYLCFKGRNLGFQGQPSVFAYYADSAPAAKMHKPYTELGGGWQQFVLDISAVNAPVDIIFNGGYIDSTGNPGSAFEFSSFKLY